MSQPPTPSAKDFETLKNAVDLAAYNFFSHPKDGWSLTPAGVELLISALRPWMGQAKPSFPRVQIHSSHEWHVGEDYGGFYRAIGPAHADLRFAQADARDARRRGRDPVVADVLEAAEAVIEDGEIDFDDVTTPEAAKKAQLDLIAHLRDQLCCDDGEPIASQEPAKGAEKLYALTCDECGCLSPVVTDEDDVVDDAIDAGWKSVGHNEDDEDLCPACIAQPRTGGVKPSRNPKDGAEERARDAALATVPGTGQPTSGGALNKHECHPSGAGGAGDTYNCSCGRTWRATATSWEPVNARFDCAECALGRDCELHDPPPEPRPANPLPPIVPGEMPIRRILERWFPGAPEHTTKAASELAQLIGPEPRMADVTAVSVKGLAALLERLDEAGTTGLDLVATCPLARDAAAAIRALLVVRPK